MYAKKCETRLKLVLGSFTCSVSSVGEVGGERSSFVSGLPLSAGTVVVVGVDVVVVDVHPREKGGSRRAAHGGSDVRVPNFGPLIANRTQRPRHEI